MNDEEVRRTFEYGEFFITLSAFTDRTASAYVHFPDCPQPARPYNSKFELALDKVALARFFEKHVAN
jgi:hypothetical protein